MKTKIFILVAVLFTSPAFAAKDKAIINSIEDIKKCEQQYWVDDCIGAYQKFVDKNRGKALEAAKVGRTAFAQWVVFPTFDKVYQRSKDIAICKDEDFQRSWVNALGQFPSSDVYKLAQKYLKNECSPHLVNPAMHVLDGSLVGSTEIENFCPLLKANGKTHKACEQQPAAAKPAETEQEVSLPKIEKSKIKPSQIKAYRGPEGIRVFVAEVEGEKDIYLVKFQGIRGPWNKKTILSKSVLRRTDGSLFYWAEYGGSTRLSLSRDCVNGYCYMEMYAPESGYKEGVAISYDEKESEKATPQDLMATF